MKKLLIFTGLVARLALPQPPPPPYPPQELDNLVSRIALYPDPLLSQVLAAAGYPNEIPDAAAWSNQHSYLHGDALAAAIREDRLPWDPAVQALLPFPSVLNMMVGDMGWTTAIGNAFLADPNGVMDAVQRRRQEASSAPHLSSPSPHRCRPPRSPSPGRCRGSLSPTPAASSGRRATWPFGGAAARPVGSVHPGLPGYRLFAFFGFVAGAR